MEALTNYLHSLMNAAGNGDSKRAREIAESCLIWARLSKTVNYERGYLDGMRAGRKQALARKTANVRA